MSKKQIFVNLPCSHQLSIELYKSSLISQLILNKLPYCIECNKKYSSNESNILKNIYNNIQNEKKELKKTLNKKKLSKEEKQNLKLLRKEYYENIIKVNKPNLYYFDLVLEIFYSIFDSIYCI